MAQDLFSKCFAIVVGIEGGYTDDPEDPGNWTGGEIGNGELNGTKFGISAAAYPDINIRDLDIQQAQALYQRDYWNKLRVPLTAPVFSLLMFDAAVNHGVEGSIKWMQMGLGVKADGDPGDITLGHLRTALKNDRVQLCADVLAARIHEMPSFSAWEHDGLGWSRRCALLPFEGMQLQKEIAQ